LVCSEFVPGIPSVYCTRSSCIVAAARRQLLFDCGLDSRQRRGGGRAAWCERILVIGIGCHSQKNIAQYPIYPNTGQYRPIPGTPIPVSFEPYTL